MSKRMARFTHFRFGLTALCACCLQLFTCSCAQQGIEPSYDAQPPRQPPRQPQSSTLQVSFETTEANRQRARDADQPVLLKGQAAVYPDVLLNSSIGNGWVELLIAVKPDGSVDNTQVLSSSHAAFEAAAIESVEQWQFEQQTKQKSIRHRVFFQHEPADHYQPTPDDH